MTNFNHDPQPTPKQKELQPQRESLLGKDIANGTIYNY